MRLATIVEDGRPRVAVVDGESVRVLPPGIAMRGLAALEPAALDVVAGLVVDVGPRPLDDVVLGPAVPDPGAIYTIGYNYGAPGEPPGSGPTRPQVFGKAPSSVAGHGATLRWDRSLTDRVDPEIELGIVIGREATAVSADDALDHVFGYTCINDISSRDPWLDGDQWLMGKSMPGFCPVGPWIVTADELDPRDLAVGCTLDGVDIQRGRTSQMRFSVAQIVSYVSRHATLRPGDLIAAGTPSRLHGELGPDRHLQPGDVVTVWIEHIGELTTTIA